MSFSSWLRSEKRRGCPRKRRTFRPTLESLEDRCVPSTLEVTNLGEGVKGSLRYEIAQAQSGDTIVFDKKLNGGTIRLYSGNELDIDKNLTIQGPGAGLLTISSTFGTYNSRIFEVDHGATVNLSGMTLEGGGGFASNIYLGRLNDGFGGAILNLGTLTITGCTLSNNSAVQPPDSASWGYPLPEGGAIYNCGTLSANGCTLSNNSALNEGQGGGIYNTGTLTLSGCTLVNNSAYYGGGIYNYYPGTATVSGCTFTGNTAGAAGGGIYNESYTAGSLTVLDSIFRSNSPDNINGPYTDGGGNTFN